MTINKQANRAVLKSISIVSPHLAISDLAKQKYKTPSSILSGVSTCRNVKGNWKFIA